MTRLHEPLPAFARREMFVNDLGLSGRLSPDGSRMAGTASVAEHLRGPDGSVRPAVLATAADVLAGIPACRATAPRLALTLDIAVRTLARPAGEQVAVDARVLKVGRNTVATEATFTDPATGALVACGYLTFMPSPRPQDLPPPGLDSMATTGTLAVPLAEHVGARVTGDGTAEIDHRPFVTQASGALQGGIVALLAELAAESLAGRPVLDLDVRYLATIRRGPGRATAEWRGDDLVRVEVRDAGADDRLAAVVMARMPGRR